MVRVGKLVVDGPSELSVAVVGNPLCQDSSVGRVCQACQLLCI